ncbi:glycosyltransferase family 2 protein [Candidatus Margulisiibacteriota bacterium]
MKISVIIPTFNRKDELRLTLNSLLKQSFRDFELIVADDGSSDGTNFMVDDFSSQSWFPVKHCWHENAGRSAARNMGLKKAVGEVVVFIDDHIILDEHFLLEHKKVYDTDGITAARGRSVLVNDVLQVVDVANLEPLIVDKNRIQDPFYTFITNNLSVKRSALLEVNGFDEDFKNYGFQDSELGYRIKRKGHKFTWVPEAIGFIFSCGHTLEKSWERARQVGMSAVIFARKHPEGRLLVGVNRMNKWFFVWASRNREKRVNSWKHKQNTLSSAGNTKKADKYNYWIKHYYFCKGMFDNQNAK